MSLVIKKHSHTRASTARIFRGVAKLTDGKFAVLTFNSNITAKSGSTSEKNNTPKLYVTIYNSDWSTFLTQSFQVGNANAKQQLGQIASMAVDSGNGIHVVYNYRTAVQNLDRKTQGQTLRYRKLTYNGTTLTVGGESTIDSNSNSYYTGVDIDVPRGSSLTTNPVVGRVRANSDTQFVAAINNVGGSSLALETITTAARGISIALNNTDNNTSYKWIATTYQLESGTDVGDAIYHGTGSTTTTPVLVSSLASNLNVGLGSGQRHLSAFRHNDTFIITGPVAVNEYSQFLAAYNIPMGSSATIAYSPTNIAVGGKFVANSGYAFAATQLDTGNTAFVTHLTDGKNVYAQVFDYVLGASMTLVKFSTKWRMDQQYLGKNNAPALIYSGDRSVAGAVGISCIVDYPESYQYVLYRRVPTGGKITGVMTTPATNGTMNKSNATMVVTISGNANNNVVGRVHLQTAKDLNFTTEVSDFYSDYQTYLKSMAVNINPPAGVLGQGTFYARNRIVDQLGGAYSWNDSQKFYVSHKPTATVVSPVRGSIAVYNVSNTVTFVLGFSDPDSTDSQTAYRIQVLNLSGTSIADTGKVSSSAKSIDVAIGSGNVDQDLIVNAWVWDTDDVMSDPATSDFKLAVLPSTAIDFPINGTAIATATPTYSWENTLPSGRTQNQYRVTVRKGTTLVWDSAIQNGDADTINQPAGYLKNGNSYTVTVWIKDNLGMTANSTVTFPTQWTKPAACPAPYVDLSLYEELGFAYITMVPPTIDPGLYPNTKMALMRRSLFSNYTWEQVGSLQMGAGLNYSIIDTTLPGGVDSFYATVLQIDNGGDLSIGDPEDSDITKVSPTATNYWLVNPDHPEMSTVIPIVTADSYTDEVEQETTVIANRGRWVEQGDDLGPNGSLTAKIYDREASLGNAPIFNYLKNPRVLSTGTGVSGIANWGLFNGNYLTRNTYSPCPVGRTDCIAFGKTGASDSYINQVIKRSAGDHTFSVWVETSLIAAAAGKSITIGVTCKNIADTTIGTFNQTFALTVSGSAMIPTGAVVYTSPIGNQFNWYRLNRGFTAPAGTVSMHVAVTLVAPAGDRLTVGAASLYDSPNSQVKFFDGYTNGAEHMGDDKVNSTSFTAGRITARAARRRLMALRKSRDVLYLRNPFGDVFQVNTGQIQVDRIAGTGTNEFVQMTIPYFKVGS